MSAFILFHMDSQILDFTIQRIRLWMSFIFRVIWTVNWTLFFTFRSFALRISKDSLVDQNQNKKNVLDWIITRKIYEFIEILMSLEFLSHILTIRNMLKNIHFEHVWHSFVFVANINWDKCSENSTNIILL